MTKQFRDFESAREFARSLVLNGKREWHTYAKSGKKPDNIPANPESSYKNNGWKGYGDWLGTGRIRTTKNNSEFRPFKEAREFVRNLNLSGQIEWRDYCKSGNKPDDIPSSPHTFVYGKEWLGWGDFLGTGNIRITKFRPFKEAREFVRSLGLKSRTEWREYAKSGEKPKDIPSNLEISYKNQGWKGLGDFLGTGNTGHAPKVNFQPFKEAREFVRKLGLKNQKEWNEYCKSGKKPDDITSSPYQTYDNKGWMGYGDWLGTSKIYAKKNHNSEWRSFKEAKEFVRSLGLKGYDEWFEYCKSGKKPVDIPSQPWKVYKEWNKK